MSEIYQSNWFALGLLGTVALLAVISIVGYAFNPSLFSSFSVMVFSLISAIAGYMIWNIKKIADEIKNIRKKD